MLDYAIELFNCFFYLTLEIDSSCHASVFRALEAISILLRSIEAHFLSRVDHQYIKQIQNQSHTL